MKNIVLIGMPGSGKTTVGALLAERLHRPLLDTDAMVEAAAGREIPEIFAKDGEGAFRDLETAAAQAAAAQRGAVIATGGGIVLRPENMAELSATGLVFFLHRPVEDIVKDDHSGRPLIGADREKVLRLYTERIALYQKYGQYPIEGVATAEAAADAVQFIYQNCLGT